MLGSIGLNHMTAVLTGTNARNINAFLEQLTVDLAQGTIRQPTGMG